MEKRSKRWLLNTRDVASPLYCEYIEGMLADIIEVRQRLQQNGCSEFEIRLRLLPHGVGFCIGVVGLTWSRLRRAISISCYAVEQLLRLNRSTNTLLDASGLMLLTFRGLHQVTGCSGHYASRATVWLSPAATVTWWDNSAEQLFGFTSAEIVGQTSIGTFIPPIESGGRSLADLLRDICTSPRSYSLNFNENQSKSGERFWMLWINIPQHDATGDFTGVFCFGIRTEETELFKPLVQLWQSKF